MINARAGSAATLMLCILAVVVQAHDEKPHSFADLIRTWSFDPLVVFCLTISATLYTVGVIRLWRSANVGSGISRSAAIAFAAAWIFTFTALVSPLHPWGQVLFSAHMTQHEILMLISAPLFVLSRPWIAALWALPPGWRLNVRNAVKAEPVAKLWGFITNPLAAWAIHAAALWIWHIPYLFQSTLTSDLLHTVQHASFFLSALLFWWAIITGGHGVASYGAGVLYLFTTSIHSGILGAFLTFSKTLWYPAYIGSTESWGLQPIEDQQIGGMIMWVPAGLVYIAAGLIMFAGWLRESDRLAVRRENAAFAEVE
jgi:putative membrane protein